MPREADSALSLDRMLGSRACKTRHVDGSALDLRAERSYDCPCQAGRLASFHTARAFRAALSPPQRCHLRLSLHSAGNMALGEPLDARDASSPTGARELEDCDETNRERDLRLRGV